MSSCSGTSIFGDDTCAGLTPVQEQELVDVVEKTQLQSFVAPDTTNFTGNLTSSTSVTTPTITATQIYPTTTSLKLNGDVFGGVSDTYIRMTGTDINIIANSDITINTSDFIILQGKVSLNNTIKSTKTNFTDDQELITKLYVDDSINLQNAYDRGPNILTKVGTPLSITGPAGIETGSDIKVYDDTGVSGYETVVSSGSIILKDDDPSVTSFGSVNYSVGGPSKFLKLQVDKGNAPGASQGICDIEVDGEIFRFRDDRLDMNSKKITELTEPTDAQDAATKNYVDTTVLGVGGKIKVTFDNNIDWVTTSNPIWTDGVITVGWDAPQDITQIMVNNAPSSGNVSYYSVAPNASGPIGLYGVSIPIGGGITSRAVQRIWLTPSDPASGILNYLIQICNLPNAVLTVEKW